MKNVNILFVISTIYVPIMMILLFYPQINDFYTYSVPLNSLVVGPNFFGDPEQFEKISKDIHWIR